MPKQSKTKTKSRAQLKVKSKVQPKTPGITSKWWYWVMLAAVMVVVFSVAGYIMNLTGSNIVVLMFTIVLIIGLMGYVSITPSKLSKSKRATFLFVGASVIGFSIWAAITLISTYTEFIETLFADTFSIIPSLVICLTIGAFIGELLGKNSKVQAFFFKPEDNLNSP